VLAVWFWAGENLTSPTFAVLRLSSFVHLIGSALSRLGWIWAPISVVVLLFGVVLSYRASGPRWPTPCGRASPRSPSWL